MWSDLVIRVENSATWCPQIIIQGTSVPVVLRFHVQGFSPIDEETNLAFLRK